MHSFNTLAAQQPTKQATGAAAQPKPPERLLTGRWRRSLELRGATAGRRSRLISRFVPGACTPTPRRSTSTRLPGASARIPRRSILAPTAGASTSTPFGYNDTETIESELRLAGFAHVQIEALPGVARAACAKEVALALVLGSPLGGELAAQGKQEEALLIIEQAIIDQYGNAEIAAPMQALVVTASS